MKAQSTLYVPVSRDAGLVFAEPDFDLFTSVEPRS